MWTHGPMIGGNGTPEGTRAHGNMDGGGMRAGRRDPEHMRNEESTGRTTGGAATDGGTGSRNTDERREDGRRRILPIPLISVRGARQHYDLKLVGGKIHTTEGTIEDGAVGIVEGKIVAVGPRVGMKDQHGELELLCEGMTLAAGLIDLHVVGWGARTFTRDMSAADHALILEAVGWSGATAIYAEIMIETNDGGGNWTHGVAIAAVNRLRETMEEQRHVRMGGAAGQGDKLQASIRGIHIRWVSNPVQESAASTVTIEQVKELVVAGKGSVTSLTVPGAWRTTEPQHTAWSDTGMIAKYLDRVGVRLDSEPGVDGGAGEAATVRWGTGDVLGGSVVPICGIEVGGGGLLRESTRRALRTHRIGDLYLMRDTKVDSGRNTLLSSVRTVHEQGGLSESDALALASTVPGDLIAEDAVRLGHATGDERGRDTGNVSARIGVLEEGAVGDVVVLDENFEVAHVIQAGNVYDKGSGRRGSGGACSTCDGV